MIGSASARTALGSSAKEPHQAPIILQRGLPQEERVQQVLPLSLPLLTMI